MRYTCYHSYSNWDTIESLWLLVQTLNGFLSVQPLGVEFYVPERYGYMLYLIDAELIRRPSQDYIL